MRAFKQIAGALAATCLALASAPAFAACDADTALFEDDFEFLDVSWGDADDSISVDDGALVIQGKGGVVNLETKNTGGTVCVDLTIVDAPKPENSPAGIVFWWQDWDNYYSVFVWADGWLEVRRMVNGKSKTLFTDEAAALETGTGETNSIELTLKPKDAALTVNGTEVRRFKAKRPRDGGTVGLYGISPDDAPATFVFDNFVVNAR